MHAAIPNHCAQHLSYVSLELTRYSFFISNALPYRSIHLDLTWLSLLENAKIASLSLCELMRFSMKLGFICMQTESTASLAKLTNFRKLRDLYLVPSIKSPSYCIPLKYCVHLRIVHLQNAVLASECKQCFLGKTGGGNSQELIKS